MASTACRRDTTPRILRRSSVKPPGSVAPDGAYGTTIPATTFGAPHTTVVVPEPKSMSTRLELVGVRVLRDLEDARARATPVISSPGASSALDLEAEVVERLRDRGGLGRRAA